MPNSNQEPHGLPATKCCPKCTRSLPLSQFYKSQRDRAGTNPTCKSCISARDAARNREDPHTRVCSHLKHRAKRKGLDFDLTPEFLRSIDRDRCPYLEIPIIWNTGKGVFKAAANSKSVDRIDSAKGYTKDNVIICSTRANQILSDSTLPEIALIAHNFRRILNSTKPTNEN